MLLEMSAFRVEDNPYEDIAEGYYILNTNINNDESDHEDMITSAKAAAYFDPWKYKIERLTKGDVVFLYQSGAGIIAFGDADGKLVKRPYHGDPANADEEYCMKLLRFQHVNPPMTAAEIKQVVGSNLCFMQTMFGLDEGNGKGVKNFIVTEGRIV